ncbi:MAG: cobalt-precorrin 5A hydrolase [Marinifilaceae bacterium]|jgi:cobalt-precorrin 5A hydrolase|nr:cobalt-precorrin 5A hydrolase [Marinifilaceae bacterium]
MIGVIAITKQGIGIAKRISRSNINSKLYTLSKWEEPGFNSIDGSLKDYCEFLFERHDALVFIMATGIVVRSIAPYVNSKLTDPAVLVIDDRANNVISLLSGHLGGANKLCLEISRLLNSNPVITTASDVNGLASVDMLAQKYNLEIDSMDDVKKITAYIVNREPIVLDDKYNIIEEDCFLNIESYCKGKLVVTNRLNLDVDVDYAKLIVKNIYVGIGCRRDTENDLMIESFYHCLEKYNIDSRSVCRIASIDLKSDEKAILNLANEIAVDIDFFKAEDLRKYDHLFESSEFVRKTVGVGAVSSCASYLSAGTKGKFICEKEKYKGITISIFERLT